MVQSEDDAVAEYVVENLEKDQTAVLQLKEHCHERTPAAIASFRQIGFPNTVTRVDVGSVPVAARTRARTRR